MAHILIIDDHRDTRVLTEWILSDAGHRVVGTQDGISGLRRAEMDQPDLILMDLALPFLDGWAATRRLKANHATRHIPVVAFTAHSHQDALAGALASGCATVVAKPFEIDHLLHVIAAVLAHPQPQEQLDLVAARHRG
jgi:two-component system, cell cycle response regulator DivK